MRMHSLNTILSAFLLLDAYHFSKATTDYKEDNNTLLKLTKLRGSSQRKIQSLISSPSTDNKSFNNQGHGNTDGLRVADGDSSIMIEEDNSLMEGDEEQSYLFHSEEDNHDKALYKDDVEMMGDDSLNTEYDFHEDLPPQEEDYDEKAYDGEKFLQYPEEMLPADLETDYAELYKQKSGMMMDEYDFHEDLPPQEYEEVAYDEEQFLHSYPEEMLPADLEADNAELYKQKSGTMMDEYDFPEVLPLQQDEEMAYDEEQLLQSYPEEMLPADLEADNADLYEHYSGMMMDEYDFHEVLPLQQDEEVAYDEEQFLHSYPEEMLPADLEADNSKLYDHYSGMTMGEYDFHEELPSEEDKEEAYEEQFLQSYPEEMIPVDLEADNEEFNEVNPVMVKDEMNGMLIFP